VADALARDDDVDATLLGNRVILPASHTGSPRQMYLLYHNAMSIVMHDGRPGTTYTIG